MAQGKAPAPGDYAAGVLLSMLGQIQQTAMDRLVHLHGRGLFNIQNTTITS
jgi:hypothetical protein